MTDVGFAHGLMGAESDHDIKVFGEGTNLGVEGFEDQSHGSGSCPVGDNDQNTLVLVMVGGTSLSHDLAHMGFIQSMAASVRGRNY